MEIEGEFQDGAEFKLSSKPTSRAQATFIAIWEGHVRVTRRLADLFDLGDDCTVIANWHGGRRTDAFLTSVGHLRKLAAEY